MEIHPPSEPIHNWRDLLIHLGVITLGLFIALSLEGFVEYLHHRHIVAEARANIRQEMEDNHQSAQQDIGLLQKNIDRMKANIATLHAMRDTPKGFKGSLSNEMDFNSLEDSAWKTARDTGALAFMPYGEVQRLSDVYMLQGIVNTQSVSVGTREYEGMAPIKMGDNNPPKEMFTGMMRDDATVEIDLVALQQYIRQLDALYTAALKNP